MRLGDDERIDEKQRIGRDYDGAAIIPDAENGILSDAERKAYQDELIEEFTEGGSSLYFPVQDYLEILSENEDSTTSRSLLDAMTARGHEVREKTSGLNPISRGRADLDILEQNAIVEKTSVRNTTKDGSTHPAYPTQNVYELTELGRELQARCITLAEDQETNPTQTVVAKGPIEPNQG